MSESIIGSIQTVPAELNEDCHYCGYPFDQGEKVVTSEFNTGKVYCCENCLLQDFPHKSK